MIASQASTFALMYDTLQQAVLSLQGVNFCEVISDEHTHRTKCDYFQKGNNTATIQNVRPFFKTLVFVLRMRMFTVRAPHSTVPWGTRAMAEATKWIARKYGHILVGPTAFVVHVIPRLIE